MNVDFSKTSPDFFGRPESPTLQLRTADGRIIGNLSNISDTTIRLKFAEPSELSFEIAAYSDGVPTPFYESVQGHKVIYTEHYGIYILASPKTVGDGVQEYKSVQGYSLENELNNRSFFLEGGTFNLWNPASPTDTILGRIVEIAPEWGVGYISPSLIGRYRTFDQYDEYLLNFVYGTAPDKYRCVFTFDPYTMTINAYDAAEEREMLGVYLDYNNLVTKLNIEEKTSELVTAMRPYGADELNIRSVNPIGTDWLYNLDYFIDGGDIPTDLAKKWRDWEIEIKSTQELYRGLVALKASALSQVMAQNAALTDLEADLDDLINQQSQTIQAQATEITDAGKESQKKLLDEINDRITAKKAEIKEKESEIELLKHATDGNVEGSYQNKIQAINQSLALTRYFTTDEQAILRHYFIEKDLTENTFVATDINDTVSGTSYSLKNRVVAVTGSDVTAIEMMEAARSTMYTLTGGNLKIGSGNLLSCDIIRGTLEIGSDGKFVLSVYSGDTILDGSKSQSGTITIAGNLSNFAHNIEKHIEESDGFELILQKGTEVSFYTDDASLYATANISDYQRLSVEMELYEFAQESLADLATPTYEFSVDSGNFLFAKEFEQFKNEFRNGKGLGNGVYLRISDDQVIKPILIEMEFSFEDWDKLSLTFSNRYKRHDTVNNLKDMLNASYSTSRDLDASKYIYGKTVEQATASSKFMNSSLDAAKNNILAAEGNSVRIDGGGIHVGGEDTDYQLRITNGMIAMTRDGWQTAELAMGLFSSPETGDYYGVNATVIGGKLIVGNNLVIENVNDMGVMQFKVDASGAWLNNATMCVQCDEGGKILIDPRYGIMAGTGDLYTVGADSDGKMHVLPSCVGNDGKVTLDDDGIPTNANFYIDSNTGKAYFRGDGVFSGTIHAKDGDFSGTIKAAILDGTITGGESGGLLKGVGLDVGDGNFVVDSDGNVKMAGSINLTGGNITWGDNSPVKYQFSTSVTGSWHDAMTSSDKYRRDSLDGGVTWGEAYQFRGTDGSDASVPSYIHKTYISETEIRSPKITGNKIEVICPETSEKDTEVGFILTGEYQEESSRYLRISSWSGDVAPITSFTAPNGATAMWNFPRTDFAGSVFFEGYVSFANAKVSGIHATFA